MSGASQAAVPLPELDGRIESVKKSLDGLLQKYTDRHPDVVGARKLIEELEAQKSQELQARRKASAAAACGRRVASAAVTRGWWARR